MRNKNINKNKEEDNITNKLNFDSTIKKTKSSKIYLIHDIKLKIIKLL